MMSPNFENLKAEYADLWSRMQVRPERAARIDSAAKRLIEFKARYEGVSRVTGVPWFLIAVLHERESSADFNSHLHEGSPLTERTRRVPAGRPVSPDPPYSWETSAIDALTGPPHSMHLIKQWTIERICYETEKYNGFGYRGKHPRVNSPYLWSFSTNYESGKYVRDHYFDPGAVDSQCGTMSVLKRMMELDSSIRFDNSAPIAIDGAKNATLPAGALVRSGKGPLAANDASDVLLTLLRALIPPTSSAAPSATQPDPRGDALLLRLILNSLLGSKPLPLPSAANTPAIVTTPILSPIDKMLGGEAFAGNKTALSILSYALLAILQANGVVGVATPAGQIMTILIATFGSLGGISKIDRAIQALGVIAAKAPK